MTRHMWHVNSHVTHGEIELIDVVEGRVLKLMPMRPGFTTVFLLPLSENESMRKDNMSPMLFKMKAMFVCSP